MSTARSERAVSGDDGPAASSPDEPFSPAAPELRTAAKKLADRKDGYFRHTRTRIAQHYGGLGPTFEQWDLWNRQIASKDPLALPIGTSKHGATIWRVWFAKRAIYVMLDNGLVVTALPDRPQYRKLATLALEKRANKEARDRQEAAAARAVRGSAAEPPKPSLPPGFTRPVRKGGRLKAMRAALLGRKGPVPFQ